MDIIITLDMGPRIIRYGFVDNDNVFYESTDYHDARERDEWHIIGGHRLWHSPEKHPRTWLADWSAINYSIKDNRITIYQNTEDWVQVDKEMEITIGDNHQVRIKHIIRNRNAWEIELSAWALTAVAPGGVLVVKLPDRRNDFAYGFDEGRIVSLWSYANMQDPRVVWGDDYITLLQDDRASNPFKFGISNREGWAAYLNKQQLFVKEHKHDIKSIYPDGNVSFESYTDGNMLEMETLSPLVKLKEDETVEHIELWSLYEILDGCISSEVSIKHMMNQVGIN